MSFVQVFIFSTVWTDDCTLSSCQSLHCSNYGGATLSGLHLGLLIWLAFGTLLFNAAFCFFSVLGEDSNIIEDVTNDFFLPLLLDYFFACLAAWVFFFVEGLIFFFCLPIHLLSQNHWLFSTLDFSWFCKWKLQDFVRQDAMQMLENALEGSGGSGASTAYSEAFRIIMRVGVNDKALIVRLAAARCLKTFASIGGPGLGITELENSIIHCVKVSTSVLLPK